MNAIFRFENGDVVDAPTNVRNGRPAATVEWSDPRVTFWLDVRRYVRLGEVVYNQVPGPASPT